MAEQETEHRSRHLIVNTVRYGVRSPGKECQVCHEQDTRLQVNHLPFRASYFLNMNDLLRWPMEVKDTITTIRGSKL